MIINEPSVTAPMLVVEGKNDLHVILHLVQRSEPSLTFGIRDYEGIENVLGSMSGHVDTSGRPAVGFILDSDDDVSRTWTRIRGEFSNSTRAISLPDQPDSDGTIVARNPDTGDPRFGIWLMPDNVTNGELENFVADMIPTNDIVWPLAQEYVNGIPYNAREFAENKTLRAQIPRLARHPVRPPSNGAGNPRSRPHRQQPPLPNLPRLAIPPLHLTPLILSLSKDHPEPVAGSPSPPSAASRPGRVAVSISVDTTARLMPKARNAPT